MSSIDKLGIQGIRSFGPDAMGRIEFYSPLTLILGQNGCGKTTIIESLKFITTGEVPPGCGKGASFIHDPKMAKETIVRGQVKLRFKSTKGQVITGVRSVEVTQKAKSLVFNSLDSTINYEGPDGKHASISNKCVDFHTEMTSLLGVAKPILDNVIFCHQEDSNWPLDEGKKVKDKFDAIFNATKYIKCLETIRKVWKDKKQAANGMQDLVKALKETKDQATRLRKDLKEVEKNRQNLKEEQKDLLEQLRPLRTRLKEIMEVEANIASINGEISVNQHKLRSIREMQSELRATQVEKFTCSDAALRDLIQDFERNTRQQEGTQRQMESNLEKANRRIADLKKEESGALLLMGQLEAAQKRHGDSVRQRDQLLQKLVREWDIKGFSGRASFAAQDSSEILARVEAVLEGEKAQLHSRKRDFEAKEAEAQSDIDALRSEETTLEHDIATLQKRMEEEARKSRALRQTLSSNEEELSSTNIEDLKTSLQEILAKIQLEKDRVDVPKVTEAIKTKAEERDKLERELDEVKKKVARMNKMAQARSQYDIYVKDRSSLMQKNQFLKRKNDDEFRSIFSGPIGDNVRNELEAQMTNIRRQMKEYGETKRKLEKQKTQLGMQVEAEKRAIAKFEKEIKGFEAMLDDVCVGRDLEDAIRKSKEQIDAMLKTKGDQDSSSVMFRSFMGKIRGGEGCPLCHRDFEEGYETQMLIEEIEGKLNRLPHEMTQLKKSLLTKESLHEQLLQLRPQKEAVDQAALELEASRMKLKGHYSELEKASLDLETCSSQLCFLMSEEETCMRVQADVVTLDTNLKSIRALDDKISNIQATLGATDDDLSMDDLVKLQTESEQKVKLLRQEVDALREEVMEHKGQLQRLNDRKIQLSSRELELKMKQQETEKMREELEQLRQEKERKEADIEDRRFAVAPIKVQLKDKVEAKRRLALEKDRCVEAASKEVDRIREQRRALADIHSSVTSYLESGQEEKLSEGRRRVSLLQEEGRAKEAAKKELQDELNRILKELTTQRERKRSLDDERKIRDKETEALKLYSEISILEAKVKDFDVDKISDERHQVLVKENRITKGRATLEGRLEELVKKQRELEGHLGTRGMSNAEKNYREKLIEMKCIRVACEDLNKYFRELTSAIMKFHEVKMTAINAIIRELWRTTYKGNDIDHIEIKTDKTEAQGADKRQTYNYRVVMVKNEVEMDMRGRCSAGQKVLASLIIRMALAETFSANCGILALDEPTTNLDRENIEALSLALLNIVNRRSHQKNFQLIIITHDEEFLERLSRADFIEYFHKVSRNERGLSVITKKTTQLSSD